MPYAPLSSTCLATQEFSSTPLTGMRTSGVTAGASVPLSTICRRLSMFWKQVRSPLISYGLCSISKTTPSKSDCDSAMALSTSPEVNVVNAGLPSSSALMTPFSRGISICSLLRWRYSAVRLTARGRGKLRPAVDAARVALQNVVLLLGAEPQVFDERQRVVEEAARL